MGHTKHAECSLKMVNSEVRLFLIVRLCFNNKLFGTEFGNQYYFCPCKHSVIVRSGVIPKKKGVCVT